MYKDKRVEKKKTVTKKRNLNPIFNESFAFDIPTEKLRETTIIITVMDKDKLSRNDVIGKVGLDGMHSQVHKGLSLKAAWAKDKQRPGYQERASQTGKEGWENASSFPKVFWVSSQTGSILLMGRAG